MSGVLKLATMIFVDGDIGHVFHQFRQPIGDTGVDGRPVWRPIRSVSPCESVECRCEMGPVGAQVGWRVKRTRIPQRGGLQLQQTP